MSEYLFSIVIPAYNYAHVLTRAVESVASQLSNDAEVIIINDGSTDNTDEVANGLLAVWRPKLSNRHQLRYIKQENKGLSGTRNAGVNNSSGRYLVFLDADDALYEGALEKLRNYLSKKSPDLLIGAHVAISESGEKKLHKSGGLKESKLANFLAYLNKDISISNGATLMHRRIFETIRYHDEIRHSEDVPVFALILATHECVVYHEPIACIYKHADSMRHDEAAAVANAFKTVDALFSSKFLPDEMKKYRNKFYSLKCLSLFRILYSSGAHAESRKFYKDAIRMYPRHILKWAYLSKLMRGYAK